MKQRIIFVGGIHGVGKTTLCKKLSTILKIRHYSAGELIELENKSNFSKQVSDINKNQNILLNALTNLVTDDSIILDGHFSLINSKSVIEKIDKSVFMEIGISLVITLHGNEIDIYNRLINRDGKSLSIEKIIEFQNIELKYAEEIAKLINVNYKNFHVGSDIRLISSFINSKK